MNAVPTVSRWWRSRSDPQRIDLYTRWSYYWTLVALPVLMLVAVAPEWSEARAASGGAGGLGWELTLVVAAVAATAGCLWLTRRSFAHRGTGSRPSARETAVAAVPALLAAVVGVASVLPAPGASPAVPWLVAILGAALLLVLSVTWEMRRLTRATGALAVVVVGVSLLDGGGLLAALVVGVSLGLAVLAIVAAFRFTVWILDVVTAMERTRGVQLQLAVAEERLRFARDLHDVMGRNLSAIAVKSQLAAELSRRGRDGAAEEMDGVGRLAESSLREVREVVRGYRATDLASELAGARSVLRSAGVTTTVTGEVGVAAVPAPVQELLGWVVRESVTNVLRHSSAGRCDIDLSTDREGTTLTVRDDGAGAPATWGNGLTGLSERLAAGGGRLQAGPDGAGFVVRAAVPS